VLMDPCLDWGGAWRGCRTEGGMRIVRARRCQAQTASQVSEGLSDDKRLRVVSHAVQFALPNCEARRRRAVTCR
jgi:hypothetical protein